MKRLTIIAGSIMAAAFVLAAVVTSGSSKSVQWDANPTNEAVTNYVVRAFGEFGTNSVSVGAKTSISVSELFAPLQSGLYSVEVYAQNEAGISEASDSISVQWYQRPEKPRNIRI
jgi:hypothetical protein